VKPFLAVAGIVSPMFLGVPLHAAPPTGTCMKNSSCPVTSLSVQFQDADATGNPYPIRSDGSGSYYNGVSNVKAILDSNGRLVFDTGLPALRDMTSQYIYPLPGYSVYPLLVQPGAHYYWQTNGVLTIAPQELGTPGWPSSMCVDGYIISEDSLESYSTLYHTGVEGTSTSPTGRWLMTRVGPTTWTLETSPTCNGDVVNLRHRFLSSGTKKRTEFQYETIGYYHLPFKLSLNTF